MRTKVKRLIFMVLMPVISFLLIAIFSFANLSGFASAERNGGGFFVGSNTTLNFNATISGSSATNGGGVYVSAGGTLNMNGGAIYGNTATSNGNNIYNAGTFTMNGGSVGSSIYFGSYPKTIKASNVTIDENDVDDKGYFLGSDGERYAKIKADPFGSNYTFSDGTTIVKRTEYYFKVEPIEWRILSKSNGEAILFAEDILTAGISFSRAGTRTINGNTVYANNYEYSTIRAWLNSYNGSDYNVEDYSNFTAGDYQNNGFLNQAFSQSEKDMILTTEVDNSKETTISANSNYTGRDYPNPVSNNTNDKIWLLSYQDANNSKYGFLSCTSGDVARQKMITDYAKANYYMCNNGSWWLRSPVPSDKGEYEHASTVNCTTGVNFGSAQTAITADGIVPAITISFANETPTNYGIYNTGTMNLYGGNVYDNVYSSVSFNTKMAAKIVGTISLGDNATISVQDYSGTTPNYAINLSNARPSGVIMTFVGSVTEPDLTKLNISGYDTNAFEIVSEKNSSGNWTVSLVPAAFEFPADWKSQLRMSTYMTTTVPASSLTNIQFTSNVPSGYTQIGTLSTGLPVYQGTTTTEIAFVAKSIYAPVNSDNLFSSLGNLLSIDFSAFNTSNVTTMTAMFCNCSSLTSLDLSNFNTSKVTSVISMFGSCSSLTSIDVSKFDTSKVTNMYRMFYNCSKLTSLDLSKFDTSKVTDMRMFSGCSNLTSLDVSKFDTSKVTDMGHMFYSCSKLTSLDLSNFNTSNVTNMYFMFYSCKSLASLDISKFNTSKVTDMGYMFSRCSSLTSLDVSKFDTSKVTNMSYMFLGCSGLTSLDVSKFDTSNVTRMSSMFESCSSLASLDVSKFNTSNVTVMDYMFYSCSKLTSLDVSKFDTSKVTSMGSMFSSCSKLTSLDVSKFDTSNVTDMGNMFLGCSSLTSLDVSKFDTSKVTDMGCMFSYCSSLTSIDVSKFDTSKVTNMYQMFCSCKSLTSIDVSKFDTSKVTSMRSMFGSCSSLTSLDLSSFDMSNVTNSSDMLKFGTSAVLRHIKTPYKNTSAIPITAGNTLYDISTGTAVTEVPANTTASKTYATKFTINFDAGSGSCNTSSMNGYYGCSLSESGQSLPTATRSGYTFNGWFTSSSGGSKVSDTTMLDFTSDTTLFAQWTDTGSTGGGGSSGGETGDLTLTETLSQIIWDAFSSVGLEYSNDKILELIFYSQFDTAEEAYSALEYASFSEEGCWYSLGSSFGDMFYLDHGGSYSVAFTCGKGSSFSITPAEFRNVLGPFSSLCALDMSGVYVSGSNADLTDAYLPNSLTCFATPFTWEGLEFAYKDIDGNNLDLSSPNGTQLGSVIHHPYSITFGDGGFWFGGDPIKAKIEVSSDPLNGDDIYNWEYDGTYLIGYIPYNRTLLKFVPICDSDGYLYEASSGQQYCIINEDLSSYADSNGYVNFGTSYSSSFSAAIKDVAILDLRKSTTFASSETCILPEKKGFVVEIVKEKKAS